MVAVFEGRIPGLCDRTGTRSAIFKSFEIRPDFSGRKTLSVPISTVKTNR